jgi:hypothetical protein
MLDWSALEDGVVITSKMVDWQVWNRCNAFGTPALVYALERLIEDLTKGGLNGDVLRLGYEVD